MELNPIGLAPTDIIGASCNLLPPSMNDNHLPANSIDQTLLSLAMAFVPYQIWENPYTTDVALQRGTIFPSLDKPWIGEEAVSK